MATISQRKDKDGNIISYVIRVYRGYGDDGKRLKPFTTTYKPPEGMSRRQVEKEVRRYADDFEDKCLMRGHIAPTTRLSEFIPKYLEIVKCSLAPITYTYYKRIITDLVEPALGHLKLCDITPTHIQNFVTQLVQMAKEERDGKTNKIGKAVSPATVRRYLVVVQSIFRQAVKLGILPDTPAATYRLTLPKMQAPKIDIFSRQEAAEILKCLQNEDLQFQVLIQLAIFTGARRGELVALKFSDVDFEQHTITISRTGYKIPGEPLATKAPKDYETRTVSINESCVELLRLLQAEKEQEHIRIGTKWVDEDWIFTQWNGVMMNPMTPTKQFSKFLAKNNLPHRKFHSLRHTSATLLLYAGVNIKQVQGRLGHGDIETTNKYLHLVDGADAEAADKLDKLLSGSDNET